MPLKTEQEHYRELIEALKIAVDNAVALGFYRNQSGWMKIAALLNDCTNAVTVLANKGVNLT